jgi:hypothetical protein
MRGKKTISFSTVATLFMVLLLSSSIAPRTASVAPNQQPAPAMDKETPMQSETMTFTSGESINFTSMETMTISKGNTINVSSGVSMTFSSNIKMQFIQAVPDGVLQPCDYQIVFSPIGYLPDPCSWWEVVDSTGKPLGEFHVDQVLQPDQFHIDMVYPGNIIVPVGGLITAVRKIDVIEPCRYYEVHRPAHWYPAECSWWEIIDPETGSLTGYEFHVDWTNESCEFHIDDIIPGPYVLPFPWYEVTARMKIPGFTPCTYLTVEEPAHWYPAECSWWELLDSQGLPTGYEFHVDWTNESCEFHIDEVYPEPYIFPGPGVPYFLAQEKIASITACDWFVIGSPGGYIPETCTWWKILDPSGRPTGLEFHIDASPGDGTFHVDQVTPADPIIIPWYPPTATITVVKKIDTIAPCNWFKVSDLATTPAPCTWWKVTQPDIGDLEFHVDIANPDGTFHVDIASQVTTFLPTYAVAAEQKIETIQPCDWFVVIDPPTGWLPPSCSWWRITWPTEWAGVTFHVDSNDGISQFHIDNVGQLAPRNPPPWSVTAEYYTPTLPWYMKSPYPDYAPSGMPDFDQRQGVVGPWVDQGGTWSHCGPVAVANSLWWLDSEFETNTIPPPAIIDNFPLVQTYGQWDDHDPQNAPWLVEHLAYLMDTNGLRTGMLHSGTNVFDMEAGITQYLSWSGVNPLGDVDGDGNVTPLDESLVLAALGTMPGMPGWDLRADIFPVTLGYPPVADNIIDMNDLNLVTQNMGLLGLFHEHTELAPTWDYIVEQVMMCQDVELLLVPWFFNGQDWYRYDEGAHYVTVAGLNATTGEIVFSDPIRDNAEAGGPGDVPVPHIHMPPEPPYVTHNDALYVSHDMYHIIEDPCPGGPLTIPDFFGGAIPPPGQYPAWKIQIEAAVVTCPYEVNVHDVAVTGIVTSKTGCSPKETVGVNRPIDINVTVTNEGDFTETFNVTIYTNATLPLPEIAKVEVTLLPAETTTIVLKNVLLSSTKGGIRITAVADTVPGETDTADNTGNYDQTFVTLAGDVDGNKAVNIFDIVRMAGVYGVRYPNPRYNPNCDLDNDGDIDIFDIVIAAGNYGKSW